MKSSTLRTFISVHTWVGLVAGFALFIAFYAGAVTLFHEELVAWETPPPAVAAPQHEPQVLIDAVLAAHPKAKDVFYVRLPDMVLEFDERHFRLDADGKLEEFKERSQLVEFIYRLHYTAGLPRSWGIYVLGVVCVLYGLALASGVIIYAPTFFKDLFALRIGKNIKRMWQDAHNAIGILSLPFHLMYAWSSAVLALGVILLAPFQYLVFDGKLLQLVGPDISAAAPPKAAGVKHRCWPDNCWPRCSAWRRAWRLKPWSTASPATPTRSCKPTAISPEDRFQCRRRGAERQQRQGGARGAPDGYSPGTRFLRSLQTLHFGSFGAAAVQWMYFVLGMAGAFLFYSGNLLWIEARRKRHKLVQPRSGKLMAQATLGVCLGCVAGVSAVFLANKLGPADSCRVGGAQLLRRVLWLRAVGLRPSAGACGARAAHTVCVADAGRAAGALVEHRPESAAGAAARRWRGGGRGAGIVLFAILYWRMARAVLHAASTAIRTASGPACTPVNRHSGLPTTHAAVMRL
jgi:uncharacterized iron-regulated membrane protein